ncbi:TPA: DUF334 domain-containing protein [Clostridioides difficile]|nr:DUF334 domain-containing protein [Staphylococcus epidermidis]HBH2479966.1 DUF334 domain-containing protein [Clostridioides difficile]HBH2539335.1 DUF334 domain-containing protein [Clostridioides difficile]
MTPSNSLIKELEKQNKLLLSYIEEINKNQKCRTSAPN